MLGQSYSYSLVNKIEYIYIYIYSHIGDVKHAFHSAWNYYSIEKININRYNRWTVPSHPQFLGYLPIRMMTWHYAFGKTLKWLTAELIIHARAACSFSFIHCPRFLVPHLKTRCGDKDYRVVADVANYKPSIFFRIITFYWYTKGEFD